MIILLYLCCWWRHARLKWARDTSDVVPSCCVDVVAAGDDVMQAWDANVVVFVAVFDDAVDESAADDEDTPAFVPLVQAPWVRTSV